MGLFRMDSYERAIAAGHQAVLEHLDEIKSASGSLSEWIISPDGRLGRTSGSGFRSDRGQAFRRRIPGQQWRRVRPQIDAGFVGSIVL